MTAGATPNTAAWPNPVVTNLHKDKQILGYALTLKSEVHTNLAGFDAAKPGALRAARMTPEKSFSGPMCSTPGQPVEFVVNKRPA
jgi:hypothetical protein